MTSMMYLLLVVFLINEVLSGPGVETYKDQYCTDPRTLKKHAAYSEWADAYSCTKHRCQPGGRNLAIYTVGCKRVEAPESAIECEEVVEDTNMQFPYCCTRLRCLVVVRGEVWTRVLGQPWETLPAAPWSHMYKMKKPPPSNNTLLPEVGEKGPVYELSEPESDHDKNLRAKKTSSNPHDCNEAVLRAAPTPDIVIALSTNKERDELEKPDNQREKRVRHVSEDELRSGGNEPADIGDTPASTEKSPHKQMGWTEITQNSLNDHESRADTDTNKDGSFHQPEFQAEDPEKKDEKPSKFQILVDAIGTRMRDIESVVHRMSEKVHKDKPVDLDFGSGEKSPRSQELQNHHRSGEKDRSSEKEFGKTKKPNPDAGHYKRFSVKSRSSKYLHGTSDGIEQPFVEEYNINGYFNDASNSIIRQDIPPKETPATYMAPVETRRKEPAHIMVSNSEETGKKKKKHHSKKRRGITHGHKKHHKDAKKKKVNEADKINGISLEDSSAIANS